MNKRIAIASGKGGTGKTTIDGSPGTGCPVIASLTGADHLLAVTEPTMSGRQDLKRVADLAAHFGAPGDMHQQMGP